MKVVCKINNIFDISDDSALESIKKYILLSDGQTNLVKNEKYVVYGISFRNDSPWYYLCQSDDDSPTAYPAELFEINDGSLSSCWIISAREPLLAFREWANDPSFYERLVDSDPSAIATFKNYQALMESE